MSTTYNASIVFGFKLESELIFTEENDKQIFSENWLSLKIDYNELYYSSTGNLRYYEEHNIIGYTLYETEIYYGEYDEEEVTPVIASNERIKELERIKEKMNVTDKMIGYFLIGIGC
jgi:hypothetical protein